ncbi:MAG: ATP-binding protein [Alkalispirochaeta sp.]
MYFPRYAEASVRRLAEHFPAVVVSGARQSGKTTLLRHCFPDYSYVSLDLPSKAEQAERNPDAFFADHPEPLIIDEVQYAPAIFRHLKVRIDADRHRNGRFLLTGSQDFTLMGGVSESLAGRVGILRLETLALNELPMPYRTDTSRAGLLHKMVRGHFPELWRQPDLSTYDYYAAYLATYLERDVRQVLNVGSLRDFERFLRVLAARSGSVLNKSDVARDVGISLKAVADWISVLHVSGQIALLEPWFTNITKRVVKTPKLYFCDSGLLSFLLNLTPETLPPSQMLGAVWETWLYAELRKQLQNARKPAALWFYRDQRGREVDFVLERGGELAFLEAKWHEHPGQKEAQTILTLAEELHATGSRWNAGRLAVIGTPPNSYPITETVDAIGVADMERVLA